MIRFLLPLLLLACAEAPVRPLSANLPAVDAAMEAFVREGKIMEQTMPYTFDTEFALKGPLYDALAGR